MILNFKTYLDTEILVKEIKNQKTNHEIIIQVVDNCSPNESFEYLSKHLVGIPNVFLYHNDFNSGFAKGNNVGLRLLKQYNPDFALVLNNDVHFKLDVLDKLIDTYSMIEDAGAISPLQCKPNGELEKFSTLDFPDFIFDVISYTVILKRFRKEWKYKENTIYPNIQKVFIIPGCFIFIDFKLFESVEFFEESTFLFCEERFLTKKLNDINKNNYLLLDCSYIHDHSKTIKQEVPSLRQAKLLKEGKILFTKKHRTFPFIKVCLLELFWQYYKLFFYIRKLLG